MKFTLFALVVWILNVATLLITILMTKSEPTIWDSLRLNPIFYVMCVNMITSYIIILLNQFKRKNNN